MLWMWVRVSSPSDQKGGAGGVGAHSPIRSGRLASAPHSGQRGLLLGWRRQRCPRRLRRPRCWSPGPWSLCAGPPSWVPCTDSWDSTSARGSRSISASSALGGRRSGWSGCGCDRTAGRQNASLVPRSGDGARRLLLLHGGMVLYLGSLVPNSALTEKEAGHMLTHALWHTLATFLVLSPTRRCTNATIDALTLDKHMLRWLLTGSLEHLQCTNSYATDVTRPCSRDSDSWHQIHSQSVKSTL